MPVDLEVWSLRSTAAGHSRRVKDFPAVDEEQCQVFMFASDRIVTEVALTQWLLSGGLISALRDTVPIMELR